MEEHIKPEDNRWNTGPILNLVGESDNYTPASLVYEMSEVVNNSGGNSSIFSSIVLSNFKSFSCILLTSLA